MMIHVDEIQVGDIMIVKPGQKLAMDGIVVKGTSTLNQAAITGESVPVKFQAKKYLLSELIDWFGTNIQFLEETEEDIIARVVVNLEAMRKWAFQYALHVKILSPEKLVESMRNDIKIAAERYDV